VRRHGRVAAAADLVGDGDRACRDGAGDGAADNDGDGVGVGGGRSMSSLASGRGRITHMPVNVASTHQMLSASKNSERWRIVFSGAR